MNADAYAAERVCREFAEQFPTPQVLRGVALASEGRIEWVALARVFESSLKSALAG